MSLKSKLKEYSQTMYLTPEHQGNKTRISLNAREVIELPDALELADKLAEGWSKEWNSFGDPDMITLPNMSLIILTKEETGLCNGYKQCIKDLIGDSE